MSEHIASIPALLDGEEGGRRALAAAGSEKKKR
jgi:hypothetical protein